MSLLRRLTVSEQAAAHLRAELEAGLRSGTMPGVIRRIVRRAANVSCGQDDRRQSFTKVEFVEGGTIGPAPRE